jgi:hypothetical protein
MSIHSKIIMTMAAGTLLFSGVQPVHAAPQFHGFENSSITKITAGSIATGDIATGSAEYRRRHRHHVSGNDILTGIGILTGIAILADVVSSSEQRNRRDRAPEQRSEQGREQDREPMDYPPIANAESSPAENDIGNAVSVCTKAAEISAGNNSRVESIRSATRNGESWRIEGQLAGQAVTGFDCQVTNGRVDSVKLGAAAI